MKIDTQELRRVAERLFTHIESLGYRTVELDKDFYWHVPTAALYDQYEQPGDLDVGQLSEDWEKLQAINDGSMPPVTDALAWLAAVLRGISDSTVG